MIFQTDGIVKSHTCVNKQRVICSGEMKTFRGEPIPQKGKSNSRASPDKPRSWNPRVCSKSGSLYLFSYKISESVTKLIQNNAYLTLKCIE